MGVIRILYSLPTVGTAPTMKAKMTVFIIVTLLIQFSFV